MKVINVWLLFIITIVFIVLVHSDDHSFKLPESEPLVYHRKCYKIVQTSEQVITKQMLSDQAATEHTNTDEMTTENTNDEKSVKEETANEQLNTTESTPEQTTKEGETTEKTTTAEDQYDYEFGEPDVN
ncbi:unnamed protein product [Schistosoma curassoni]|nr:unnamed protein product [Schistosoma curassoni]CAH8526857.1 unnamed protein product [Schistosoma curassoni]